jgi:NADH-quinone oxidoreductase subunit J
VSGGEIVFSAFAALAVFSALATITRRNPVVAAVWLVATFASVAVCYVLLQATFLAVIQVLVYAGAMMVLFVFVIMVLDVDEKGQAAYRRPSRVSRFGYYGSVVAGVGFLLWVLFGTLARQYVTTGAELDPGSEFGTAYAMGREIFKDYLFAFEAVSLLLLAAVIGAVVVARSRRDREKEAAQSGMEPEAMVEAGLSPESAREHVPPGRGPSPQQDFGAPSASGHTGGV